MGIKYFKATTKADAGRRLAELKTKLSDYGNGFNSKKFVPLILCLEDAVNSCEIQIIKAVFAEKAFEQTPVIRLILRQLIVENFELLNFMLNEIVDKGFYDKSTKVDLVDTNFAIFFGQDFELQLNKLIQQFIKNGEVSKKPIAVGHGRLFNCEIPGAVFFIFDKVNKQTQKNLDRLLEYKDLLYQKGILESMIYRTPEGTKLVVDEKGIEVNYPKSFSVEHAFKKEGITPRSIETQSVACDWNSSFKEIANETARVSQVEGKGKANLKRLENENRELYNAYSLMPNYSSTFKQLYDIEIDVFFKIVDKLIMLSYYQNHTIGIWSLQDLINKLRRSNISNKQIIKVIDLLGNKSMPSLHCRGLIILGEELVLTNFRRLCSSKIVLLENCFDEAYDKDLKGKVFEEACRKILRHKELCVLPSRVDILQPVLPEEISNRLFGKQKSRTDFDVVANLNNNLLLLECKEIKYSSTPLRISVLNLFEKFSTEHYYRAQWVSSNLSKLKSYMGIESWKLLNLDENRPINIVPLLISNALVEIRSNEGTPLLTISELHEILGNKWVYKSKGNSFGEVEIKINGRTLVLPFFQASDN